MGPRQPAVFGILLVAMLASARGEQAAAPPTRDLAVYRHVAHLGWVVRDLDAVVTFWKSLGVTDIRDAGVVELPDVTYRGEPARVRMRQASTRFGDLGIQWIQPMGGRNVYTDFLDAHGDGIHHLAVSLPSDARLAEELAHFEKAGVPVLQRGTWRGPRGTGTFAYLDTAPRGGGVTLELVHDPDPPSGPRPATSHADPFNKVTQYAFVVRDIHKVSAFYEQIGLGPFAIEKNVSLDRVFRGRPASFEMFLGWQRGGPVVFEWIQQIAGPTVYEEFLARHGEGFHHLGFNVPDMDAAVARLRGLGVQSVQSGGWDTNGHQGRFAYLDTDRHGGVMVELLWNKPR